MKVTTEKLPKSRMSLQIELDAARFEHGLDQAARRFSQKYQIHGFRRGKAPRFIIERTFGREALIQDAQNDLISKAFQDAIIQEEIEPIGPAELDVITSVDPFVFTITVPLPPTVKVGDYHTIKVPFEPDEITDEQLEGMMEAMRDRHVVLKELDEPRPTQEGDSLKVHLETFVDGETLDEREEGEERPEHTLDLVKGRLIDELYNALIGVNAGDTVDVVSQMAEDHEDERVRGKEVTFKVEVLSMQQRVLPSWEELPQLQEFEGTLEELRAKTRSDLETTARHVAERKVLDTFIDHVLEITEFDIPDVMIENMADDMLKDQGREFARYGITLEQMLQFRGETREQAIAALLPEAEKRTRVTLALAEVVEREELNVSEEEIEAEIIRAVADYSEEQRAQVMHAFQGEMRGMIFNALIDRKLRERVLRLAAGIEPSVAEEPVDEAGSDVEALEGEAEDAESTSVSEPAPVTRDEPVTSEERTL